MAKKEPAKAAQGTNEHAETSGTLLQDNQVLLSDGRTATVKQLKGKHAIEAQTRCEGDKGMYQKILLSAAVEIDGKGLPPEDFDNLDIKDFNAIFGVHSEINF